MTELAPTTVPLSFPVPESTRGLGEESFPPPVNGLAVRVTRIRVLDTKKAPFLGRERADIYPIFLLVAGPSAEPASLRTIAMFNDVLPGATLAIAPTAPPTIFRSLDRLPDYMDLHVLLMRSHERTRDIGGTLATVMGSTEGKAIVAALQGVVTAANPVAGAAITAGAALLALVGKLLSDSKDRQIFYTVGSFERTENLGIGLTHTFRDENAEVDVRVEGVSEGVGLVR